MSGSVHQTICRWGELSLKEGLQLDCLHWVLFGKQTKIKTEKDNEKSGRDDQETMRKQSVCEDVLFVSGLVGTSPLVAFCFWGCFLLCES